MGRALSTKIGPFLESQAAVLRCRVKGGKPAPQVTWFLNGQRLTSETLDRPPPTLASGKRQRQEESAAVHVEEVRLGPFRRYHQDARVTCQAANSPVNPARSKTLTLDIHRKLYINQLMGVYTSALVSRENSGAAESRDRR